MLEKYVTIFRAVNNLVFVGDDGETPAMHLGFAREPFNSRTSYWPGASVPKPKRRRRIGKVPVAATLSRRRHDDACPFSLLPATKLTAALPSRRAVGRDHGSTIRCNKDALKSGQASHQTFPIMLRPLDVLAGEDHASRRFRSVLNDETQIVLLDTPLLAPHSRVFRCVHGR